MVLSNKAVPVEYGAFRESVLRGEIPVNREISMEMNRIDFLIDSPDYYYDNRAIQGFVDFCENELTLTDGKDVTLLPSFKLWAECLLAWFYFSEEKVYNQRKHRYEMMQVKRRLVNKQYLIVGRGAAKSMYASFMQAYFLFIDTETTNQVVTAPTMRQAEETMSPIRTAITRARGPWLQFATEGSVKTNGFLKQKVASTKKGIENFITNSLLEIRPMSVDKLQGLRSKVNSVDEWLSGDVREDVIGAIEQGASKLKDWTIIATSSEGTSRGGVGDTIKMELQKILRGEYFAPNVSIWYYKLDDVKEVDNPMMWIKANPNLGATVSYATYQQEVERAEASPSARNDILAKRFGIPLEGFSYFFLYEETLLHKNREYNGMECAMGMDASQGDDFWAFTFLFPLGNGRYGVKTRSYVSETKLRKLPQATRLRYDLFLNEGSLVIMEGAILDEMDVYDDLDLWLTEKDYAIMAFGYDPYNAAAFVDRWKKENSEYGVTKVIQGVKTESVPLGELKALAFERMLYFDQELMKFSMENAIAIEDNNGNRKLSKKRSFEKIDNVAALMDAWVAYRRNQEAFG